MYCSLLIPLDGSLLSESALPIASRIAHQSGAHITIVHVRTLAELYASVEIPPIGVEARADREQAIAEAYLTGIARQLSGDGLAVTTKALAGTVAETLYDYVRDHDIDLIVMTTHGRGMVSRLWLGSVTDALIRTMPMPMVLARIHELPSAPTNVPSFRHILIPLDGSALAETVLEPAIALGMLNQSRFTLFQSIHPTAFLAAAPPAAAVLLEEQALEEQAATAQHYLDTVAQRVRNRSFDVDTGISFQPPSSAITSYAQHHNVDLIAMATHGRSGFKRMLLGSVADKVVRSAAIPVLLAPPSARHH